MKIAHRITATDAEVSRDGILSLATKIGWLVLLYRLRRMAAQKEQEESPSEQLLRRLRSHDARGPGHKHLGKWAVLASEIVGKYDPPKRPHLVSTHSGREEARLKAEKLNASGGKFSYTIQQLADAGDASIFGGKLVATISKESDGQYTLTIHRHVGDKKFFNSATMHPTLEAAKAAAAKKKAVLTERPQE